MRMRVCILVIAVIVHLYPSAIRANELCVTPTASIQQQYNSNILLNTDDVLTTDFTESDFITIVSAGFELNNRTERLDSNITARLDRLEYFDNRDLSDTDHMYRGRFTYRVNPVLSIAARAGYQKKTNPAVDYGMPFQIPPGTIILPPPIPPVPPPGTPGAGLPGTPGGGDPIPPVAEAPLPVITVPRNTISGTFTTELLVTEKASTSIAYTYDKNYYSDERFADDEAHDVKATFEYDLSQYIAVTKARLSAGHSEYDFSNSQGGTLYGSIGLTRALNELWSVSMEAGVRRTETEVWTTECVPLNPPDALPCKVVRKTLTDDNWDWLGGLSVRYGGEYGSTSLSYSRSFAAASGLNSATVRDSVALFGQYRFTRALSAILTTGYYAYRTDAFSGTAFEIEQENLFINPGMRYELTRDTMLEASYGYAWVTRCSTSGTSVRNTCEHADADRHLVSVRFSVQHPFCK